jgi:mono/diheme cytochrome c family protein
MTLRRILRWIGYVAAGFVGIVVLAGAATYGLSESRMSKKFDVPQHPITPRTDSASLAVGARLVKVKGCVDCHGANLGGSVMIDNFALGRLAAPNLTVGGRGAELEPRDWERAIRHGVRRDGSPLRVMPANEFTGMADDELEAIVGYIRSQPAVATPTTPTRVGPVIRALFVAHQFDLLPAELIEHPKTHIAHIDAEPTPKYGEYVAAGCKGCHGPGMSGGKIPGAPPDWKPAANITPTGIGHYSEDDFIRILRTGTRPDGSMLDTLMPYRLTKEMTDVELKALFAYLKTVPPKDYGNR